MDPLGLEDLVEGVELAVEAVLDEEEVVVADLSNRPNQRPNREPK